MSQYTDFLRWQSGCRSFSAVDHGCTAGDSYHQGSRSYTEPFPCPNGLPIDTRAPQEVEWHRERVARARRDAEAFDSESRVRCVAESITDEEILKDIEVIRTWANSLNKAQQHNGLSRLSKAGQN